MAGVGAQRYKAARRSREGPAHLWLCVVALALAIGAVALACGDSESVPSTESTASALTPTPVPTATATPSTESTANALTPTPAPTATATPSATLSPDEKCERALGEWKRVWTESQERHRVQAKWLLLNEEVEFISEQLDAGIQHQYIDMRLHDELFADWQAAGQQVERETRPYRGEVLVHCEDLSKPTPRRVIPGPWDEE